MPNLPGSSTQRHAEAQRLINLAKALLNRREEEMVVIYLDHAIEALDIISQDLQPASA